MAKHVRFWSALVAVLVFSGALVAASLLSGTPGSAQDPLVTESYVTEQLDIERQLRLELEARLARLETQGLPANDAQTQSAAPIQQDADATEARLLSLEQALERATLPDDSLQVVSLHAGEAIVGEAGTEMILRSGEVSVLASASGGLADLTSAQDLGDGDMIHPNHLLLVPRTDQRGVLASTDAVLLVRGAFSYAVSQAELGNQAQQVEPSGEGDSLDPAEPLLDENQHSTEHVEAIEEIAPTGG